MKPLKASELEQLRQAAVQYKIDGNLSLSEQIYRTLLDLEITVFGSGSSAVALYLYKIAELQFEQDRKAEGNELLRHAVAIWETAHPCDFLSLLSYTEAVTKVGTASVNSDKSSRSLRRVA
jgi:hypothetical protein